MHNNKLFIATLLVASFTVAAVPASAAILAYSSQSAWQAALASGTTTSSLDFSNAQAIFAASYTNGGLTFTGNGANYGNNVPYIFGSATTSSLFNNQFYLFGNGLVNSAILSTSNVYAVGFYVGCSANCGTYAQIISATSTTDSATLSTNPSFNWTGSSVQFVGIVSTSPLTQFQITSQTVVPNISVGNITIGTQDPSATPEAATLLLIGSGLGVIARFRRSFRLPTMA